jgi:hypothetical protein
VPAKNAADLNTYALAIDSSQSAVKKEKKYVCIASSLADMQHWIQVLSDACSGHAAAPAAGLSAASSSSSVSAAALGAGGGAAGLAGAGAPPTAVSVLNGSGHVQTYLTSALPAEQVMAFDAQLQEDPNFYDGETNLMAYGWFHGTMSSDEAFKILETQPLGAYLVRVSAQRPASFVISYVADNDKVIHVVWEWNDERGWVADGRADGFDTIKAILVAFKNVYKLAVLRP